MSPCQEPPSVLEEIGAKAIRGTRALLCSVRTGLVTLEEDEY
jgi:hypothetical protein